MGQTKEAEKITIHIVSEEPGCLECYRLLSAIYSKQEHHEKVTKRSATQSKQTPDKVEKGSQSHVGSYIENSVHCMLLQHHVDRAMKS